MLKQKGRFSVKKALLLAAAALLLAIGLELVEQAALPPIYEEADVTFIPPLVHDETRTYLHASGQTALAEPWSLLRMAITFGIQLIVLIILFPLGAGRAILNALKKTGGSLRAALTEGRKSTGKSLLLFAAVWAACFFLIRLISESTLSRSNWMISVFSAAAATAAAMLFSFRKTLAAKPENFFLAFMLLIGGLLAFLLPDATTVSWDDGHHFQHALNYSYVGHVRFTQQDMIAMEADNVREYSLGEAREEFLARQNELNDQGAVYVTNECHLRISEFWTSAYGLGLFLGRVLHLPYWLTWSLGRFTGLLAFSLAGYFAIRRLKSGKMILAAVLMTPTSVFLAANYSYDPGVTGLLALGLAYTFAQWQEPEKKISTLDSAVILLSLFWGCFAKQIYFPVFVFPLLLPKTKFENVKARRRFMLADLLLVVILLASFVIPFLTGSGSGDQRGGSDVNAFGQVQYVLSHPLDFAGVLVRFLGRYLDLSKAGGYLTFLAYTGRAPYTVLCQLVLAAAAFTDKREEDQALGNRIGLRIFLILVLLATVALFASSMYVSFTGVGSKTISGCQPRYLIPVIFPAMMLIGSSRIQNRMNPALYHGLILGSMAFIGFSAVLQTCVAMYS